MILKELRLSRHLSQEQLAQMSGLNVKDPADKPLLIDLESMRLGDSSHPSDWLKGRFSIESLNSDNDLMLNDGRALYVANTHGWVYQLNFEHAQFIRFAKPSSNGNHLYFIDGSLDNDIVTFEADNPQKLIDSTAMDYFPVFSKDDRYISFYSTRYGRPQLFVRDPVTSQEVLVYDNPYDALNVERAVWSGNNKLAFSLGNNVFYSEPFDFHNIKRVNDAVNYESFNDINGRVIGWFPDNKHILVTEVAENAQKLIKLNTDTNQTELITTINQGRPFITSAGHIYILENRQVYRWNASKGLTLFYAFDRPISRTLFNGTTLFFQIQSNKTNIFDWFKLSKDESTITAVNVPENNFDIATFKNKSLQPIYSQRHTLRDIVKLELEK